MIKIIKALSFTVPFREKSMEHKFEEGEIVMYKKDNAIYKIVEVLQTNKVDSGITIESYTISNDHKKVRLVLAKDLETL